MKFSKVALILYFLCCFIAVLGSFFRDDTLKLISIPIIIPSITFFYLIETQKRNYLLLLFLMCCFVGDALGIMNFENEVYYIIVPFFLANLVLLAMILSKLERFKFKIFNILSLLGLIVLIGYMWFSIVDLFIFHEGIIKILITIYGGLLFFVAILAGYNLIWKMNNTNLFVLIGVTCILISDIFYIVYNFQTQLFVLNVLHFLAQVLSYYFIAKYVLIKEVSNIE
jgi:YhhN family